MKKYIIVLLMLVAVGGVCKYIGPGSKSFPATYIGPFSEPHGIGWEDTYGSNDEEGRLTIGGDLTVDMDNPQVDSLVVHYSADKYKAVVFKDRNGICTVRFTSKEVK